MAYVTARAHALFDFRLYVPKPWCPGRERRERAQVPGGVEFATKTELGTAMVADAIGAGVAFGFVAGDEVYGRSGKLRAACEMGGKGYVFVVPVNFKVTLPSGRRAAVASLTRLVPTTAWETRSCGRGCKAHRDYEWAMVATASPRHWVLIRRKLSGLDDLAFFYCRAPGMVSLPALINVAGKRWPAEECFQQGKGQAGLDQHQVRTWHSFHRHTVLSMCALALLAVATARPVAAAPIPDPQAEDADAIAASTAARFPGHWRDTGALPADARGKPPADPGMVKVSVPEARRLLHLVTTPMRHAEQVFHQAGRDGGDGTRPAPGTTTARRNSA